MSVMKNESGSFQELVRNTGFQSFLWTQFLAAFNDNIYKMIASVGAVELAANQLLGSRYLAIAGAVFVLPFLLLLFQPVKKNLRIIAAVVRGFKNRDIAAQMETTEQVVKNTLRAIFDKIGVSDRLELALFVLHHRMLAHATASVKIEADPPRPKRSRSSVIESRIHPRL